MSEYKSHNFRREWHDKVEEFIEDNPDLGFDSPKYFIKFCVNTYMDEHRKENDKDKQLKELKKLMEDLGSD